MLGDKAVTIKALRFRGGIIEWGYDSPRQCARFWEKLKATGRTPDTGELLMNANLFLGNSITPHKMWERRMQVAEEAAEILQEASGLFVEA